LGWKYKYPEESSFKDTTLPIDRTSIISIDHGTAVAVDLSSIGINETNLLLTAAHCIDAKYTYAINSSQKDIRGHKGNIKLVYCDPILDIALLSTTEPLPVRVPISNINGLNQKNEALQFAGFPMGSYTERRGLTQGSNGMLYKASVLGFDHGWSGGGVFKDGKLVGITTSIDAAFHGTEVLEIKDVACLVPIDRLKQCLLFYKFTLNSN
jgi:hypothetical protein